MKEMDHNKYEEQSKERLKEIVKKKLKTVMIGALAIIENALDLNNIEQRNLYENCIRQAILDLGNNQIRNALTEIDMYTVSWNRYNYTIEVKRKD